MNIENLISSALEEDFQREIKMYNNMSDHVFSISFKKRIKKLIKLKSTRTSKTEHKYIPIRKAIIFAIITILLLTFIIGSTSIAYKLWNNYKVKTEGTHSFLEITNTDNAPLTLEEHYRIGINLEIYSENVLFDDEYDYWVEYFDDKSNRSIGFCQSIKKHYQGKSSLLYTVDATTMPIEVMINGCKGIFFQTHYGDMALIWDCGDYIIEVGTYGFSKNELFSIAESVHKVE